MRCLLAGVILFGLASVASAQAKAPRFEEYAAPAPFAGPTHAPVLATRDARQYRSRLREAAQEKPNFAGRYILTVWGCGTECVTGAALDAKTGRVTMLPFTLCCWGVDVPEDFDPVEFRLDSSLIVFEGARNEVESDKRTHYYTLRNGQFRELK
jgi:hypothetical protein